MKDILSKLAEIDTQSQVEEKKVLTEDSVTRPVKTEKKTASLKDVFETMATKQPIPVVGKEGGTQTTGAGFINVTDTSPAAQALSKAVGDLAQQKKLQIVVPTTPQQSGTTQVKPAAGATGQAPAGTTQMKEKWDTETKVAPSEKGKYEGKTKAELLKQYNALKAKGPHKKGSSDYGKMRELAFAIRAKSDWGKVKEEQIDEISASTLGSYVAKSREDEKTRRGHGKEIQAQMQKAGLKGVGTPIDRKLYHRTASRPAGQKLAVDKLTGKAKIPASVNEEQVNEKFKSKQQAKLMYAAADDPSIAKKTGVSQKVAKEFIKKSHGQKVGKLPTKVTKKDEGIYEAASDVRIVHNKMLGGWFVVRGPHQTPLSGKFSSKEEAQNYLKQKQNKTVKEAERPSDQVDMGAGLGAGRSMTTLEGKMNPKDFMITTEIDDPENPEDYIEVGINYDLAPSQRSRKPSLSSPGEPGYAAGHEGFEVINLHTGKEITNLIDKKAAKHIEDLISQDAQEREEDEFGARADYEYERRRDREFNEGKKIMTNKISETKKKAKPDFIDLDKDGNKKESMKKAAQDMKKKKVEEGMNTCEAAYHEGKSHGIGKHSYSCRYDEGSEEHKNYHKGFVEGLNECYGMGVYEGAPAATVGGMADQALDEEMIGEAVSDYEKADRLFDIGEEIKNLADEAMELVRGTSEEGRAKSYWYPHIRMAIDHDHGYMGKNMATIKGSADALMHSEDDEVDEGNAFTAALAKTPKGEKFSVGGKTFTDTSSYDSKLDEYTFESLDNQLNALLTESKAETKKPLTEGVSVSMSTGTPGGSDTVNINATDEDAAKVLQLIKQAGLGGFGDKPEASDYGAPAETGKHGGISVVGDHDGMMDMMKKLAGIQAQGGSEDYADEEGSEESGACGCEDAMAEGHTCGEGKEMVDEVETTDQREFQVAEDQTEEEETTADEDAEAAEDATKPASGGATNESAEDEEEDVTESQADLTEWANNAGKKGTDASFEEDIEFMTKVISGGLNKPKSTGQTTVPVIANQTERTVDHQGSVSATVDDFKKLAGIK